jgi:hypothetical protein
MSAGISIGFVDFAGFGNPIALCCAAVWVVSGAKPVRSRLL